MNRTSSSPASSSPASSSPKGFTLVELLVVIAIIGILIGMLLPAVQQVREAARRSTCQNNMRQLALAMLNYESALGELPVAVQNDVGPQVTVRDQKGAWAWGTLLLPYVEQSNLFDVLNPKRGSLAALMDSDPNLMEALQTPIATFRCPSDVAPEASEARRFRSQSGVLIERVGTANYVVNNSHSWPSWTSAPTDLNGNGTIQFAELQTGLFNGTKGKKLAEVSDGLSNTIILGERVFENGRMDESVGQGIQDAYPRAANIYGTRGLGHTNVEPIDYVAWHGIVDVAFCGLGYINDYNYWDKARAASSLHPGGVNFAFVDGSVHFIPETIEHLTRYSTVDSAYEQLLAIADGQVLNDY